MRPGAQQMTFPLDATDHLDVIQERADRLIRLAVDACRFGKFKAYSWIIREYRRKRLAWDAIAERAQVAMERRVEYWNAKNARCYLQDIDRARETFGLRPLHDDRLPKLPGAEERKENQITEYWNEIDENWKQHSPYYRS